MKIVLVGANGTIGSKVAAALIAQGHELIKVGKRSGDFQVDIEDRASVRSLYEKIGSFDAVVNASGDVAFAPLSELKEAQWSLSLGSKLMGQIHLVQEAIPFIRENGSFTLVSGITSEVVIAGGTAATTISRAIEGFVAGASTELPKGLRINVVSPTLLKESEAIFGPYFPGFIPVEGSRVAQAYVRSVMGVETGKIFKVEG